MNDHTEKIIGQRERDDALLNFVTSQAQEAILNSNLPESYKDEVLNAAVETIQKVAERKAAYYAKYGEGRRTRRSHIIYEAGNDEEVPTIISEINDNLHENTPEGMKDFTVEWIAERAGITKKTLYEWVKIDAEFTEDLERLNVAQKNDPFKTGTEEDTYVNSMMIALVLFETRDRHFKSKEQ